MFIKEKKGEIASFCGYREKRIFTMCWCVVIFREMIWSVQGHFALQQSCHSLAAAEPSWASRAPAGEGGWRPVWKRWVLHFVTEQPPQRKCNTLAMVLVWHLFFGKSVWSVYINAGGLIVLTDLPCWWQLNKPFFCVFILLACWLLCRGWPLLLPSPAVLAPLKGAPLSP